MFINIEVSRFIGAEVTSMDGVEGIFIPIPYNLKEVKKKNGERSFYASFAMFPSNSRNRHDYDGKQVIPKNYRDTVLQDCTLLSNNKKMIWGYENRNKESGLGESDFDRLIADD